MLIWMFLRPFRSLVVFLLICYFSVSAFVSDQVLKIPLSCFKTLCIPAIPSSSPPYLVLSHSSIAADLSDYFLFACLYPFSDWGKKNYFWNGIKSSHMATVLFFLQASCLPLLKEMFSFWIKKYYGILTRITMSFRKRKLYNCIWKGESCGWLQSCNSGVKSSVINSGHGEFEFCIFGEAFHIFGP